MADCSAILHTQPSEMDKWPLEVLQRWHQKAIARQPDESD